MGVANGRSEAGMGRHCCRRKRMTAKGRHRTPYHGSRMRADLSALLIRERVSTRRTAAAPYPGLCSTLTSPTKKPPL
jgi:hypothetical protein